jgi:hypothetical protein
VLLTEKGAGLETEVVNAVEEVNNEVMAAFSDIETDELKTSLKLLAGVEA